MKPMEPKSLTEFISAAGNEVPVQNVRVKRFPINFSPDFHAEVVKCARREGVSLNQYIMNAILDRMNR